MTDAQKADPKAALFALISNDGSVVDAENLLDSGLDPNCSDKGLGSALEWAAALGREGIIEVLLSRGAEINGKNLRGEVPLISALTHKQLIATHLLIDRGAEADCRSRWGHSALYYATQLGDQPLVEKLLVRLADKKPDAEVLYEAAKRGDLALTALLIDAGAELDGKSGIGAETALHGAAHYGKLEVVRFLVEKGASLTMRDLRGNTPLLHAAWNGHVDVLKLLLAAGANVSDANNLNWNALMQAALQGHVEAARLLLDNGSPLNEIDREQGATALSLAKAAKSETLAQLLVERGAKEREIRRPPQSSGYFLITDCDVCAYLPHRKELSRSETPDDIANLETVYTDVTYPERYTTDTVFIKRCTVCGTYYHHDHSIDTEDAFVRGPSISQHLLRYNLLGLKETLQQLGKHDELVALTQRYPELVQSFSQSLQHDAASLKPNIRAFLVETVVDSLIVHDRFAELFTALLRHADCDIALETALNLIWIYAAARRTNIHPYFLAHRDVTAPVADKLKAWLATNLAVLQEALQELLQRGDDSFKKRVKDAQTTAHYAHLF